MGQPVFVRAAAHIRVQAGKDHYTQAWLFQVIFFLNLDYDSPFRLAEILYLHIWLLFDRLCTARLLKMKMTVEAALVSVAPWLRQLWVDPSWN